MTIRTFFSICKYPISRFAFATTFHRPLRQLRAVTRLMRFFPTLATKHTATTATNGTNAETDSYLVTTYDVEVDSKNSKIKDKIEDMRDKEERLRK